MPNKPEMKPLTTTHSIVRINEIQEEATACHDLTSPDNLESKIMMTFVT